MGKSIGKTISKNLNGKYTQKPFDPFQQSAAMDTHKLLSKKQLKNS